MTAPRLHVLDRAPSEALRWRVARWAVLAMLLVALVRVPSIALAAP